MIAPSLTGLSTSRFTQRRLRRLVLLPFNGKLAIALVAAVFVVKVTSDSTPDLSAQERKIGIDQDFQPIQVWLDSRWESSDGDPLRVVLVANERGDSQTRIADICRWWDAKAEGDLRSGIRLAALSLPLTVDGRTLAFPPTGPAYAQSATAAAPSVWRWLGISAVDLVIVCGSEAELAWSVAADESNSAVRAILERQYPGREQPVVDRSILAVALATNRVAGVGSIPAVQLQERGTAESSLRQLFAVLRSSASFGHSSAAQELRLRGARTAAEVAVQLGEHYGHELPAVEYIPVVALWARMRRDELLGRSTAHQDAQRLAEPVRNGEKVASNESGSAIAWHLLFTELANRSSGPARQRWIELAKRAADLAFDDPGPAREVVPHHLEMSDALFMAGPLLAAVESSVLPALRAATDIVFHPWGDEMWARGAATIVLRRIYEAPWNVPTR